MVSYEEYLKACLKKGIKEQEADKVWRVLLDLRRK